MFEFVKGVTAIADFTKKLVTETFKVFIAEEEAQSLAKKPVANTDRRNIGFASNGTLSKRGSSQASLDQDKPRKTDDKSTKQTAKKESKSMPQWQQDFKSLDIKQVKECAQEIDKYCELNKATSRDGERGSITVHRAGIKEIQKSTKGALAQLEKKINKERERPGKKNDLQKIEAIQEEFKGEIEKELNKLEIEKQLNKLKGSGRSSFSNHELRQTQEKNKFSGRHQYGELKKGPDLNPFNYIKKEVKKNRAPDKIESGSSQSTPSNSIRPLAVSQLSRSSAVARAA